jgi:hypothetical protein
MATYCRNIKDPSAPAMKIIRVEDGEVTVNYDNVGDAVWVMFLLIHARVRHKARRMTPAEIDRVWAEQGQLNVGAGI